MDVQQVAPAAQSLSCEGRRPQTRSLCQLDMQYCVSRYLLQIERNNLDAAAQAAQGWGAKVIDVLSTDLMARYGNDSGYSIRNLKYMRQFAVEYPDFPFVQVPLAQITWYHHISMFPKVKDNILRAFYITESALR